MLFELTGLKIGRRALLALCAAFVVGVTPAMAKPSQASPHLPPWGFDLCTIIHRDPGCVSEPSSPSLARTQIQVLKNVNEAVNDDSYPYECADPARNGPIGQGNWWVSKTPPYVFVGKECVNCITYAVTKRRVLLGLGLPADALRFAMVRRGNHKKMHLLLLVYTVGHPNDPYVLDNRDNVIWTLSQERQEYRLLELQDAHGSWEYAP